MRPEEMINQDLELRAHVLLAEDDSELRELLHERLEADGYRVDAVSDGALLRRRLEGALPHPADYDVVLSDIRMPGCTGIDVLSLLRQRDGALPVILMSAFADEEACQEARRLGAAEIFHKPFSVDQLRATLRELVPPVAGG